MTGKHNQGCEQGQKQSRACARPRQNLPGEEYPGQRSIRSQQTHQPDIAVTDTRRRQVGGKTCNESQ